jgi:RNA polymerase sigma factor (sigma-70 family)
MDDAALLHCYVEKLDHEAFRLLVERHFNVVYFAALRQVGGDAHRARDVSQEVFAALARKAPGLVGRASLVGWLHTSTRFAAMHMMRGELRRMEREGSSLRDAETVGASDPVIDWERIKPAIDGVLQGLSGPEREVVLLRFFQGRSFVQIAGSQRTTPDAARFRLDRALVRMKSALWKRGITSTTAALAMALESQADVATPAGMSGNVATAALMSAASAGWTGAAASFFDIMTTAKTVTGGAILILGTLALGEALWGWHQRDVVQELRIQQQAAEADPVFGQLTRADAQLASLEASQRRVAVARQPSANGPLGAATMGGQDVAANRNPFAFAIFRGMYSPEFRSLMAEAQKSRLNIYYSPLFQQLNLSSADLDRFKELLVDKQFAVGDANRKALDLGMDYDAARQVIPYAQGEIEHDIKALLGDDRYATYQTYEATRKQRFLIDQLQQRLDGSSAPLSPDQASQLVQTLHASAPVENPPSTAGIGAQMAAGIRWRDFSMSVSDDNVATAAAILTPAQVDALRQIQEEQSAAAELRQKGIVLSR